MDRLGQRIAAILALDPAASAIEFEGAWWRWGEVARSMAAIADALPDAARGMRIGVLMRNHVAVVPAILEVLRGGHCLVVLNPMLPPDRLAADIAASGVPVVIGVAQDLDGPACGAAFDAIDCQLIEVTNAPDAPVTVRRSRTAPFDPGATGRDVAVEMLTSGTTGPPKRIPMARPGFEEAVFAAARFEKGRSEGDTPRLRGGVQLLLAPFSHIGGLLALLNAVVAGRSATLLPRFTVEGFRDAVKHHAIKAASLPPAALKMLYDAEIPRADLASLMAFRTGTAPLDAALATAFVARYGIPVLQNYGATEFGGVAGWTLDDFKAHWPAKAGAVGRLNPGMEGRIVDAGSGAALGTGEPGVLELRAPQIGDGRAWVRTTDIARIDAEGFLYIVGRSDNAIIRGGFKIQPDDIVRAMEAHPAVREAAVAALPDDRLGAVPVAGYLLRSGLPAPSEEEMRGFLKGRLTAYQIPTVIRPLDKLPRTASMKVDQAALRTLLGAKPA
ncbi:MAG: hypothetical protein JWR80_750 [Bradyrhizobium sp.]|nr:hypothetical protein [Bradyrhizobium sp.]